MSTPHISSVMEVEPGWIDYNGHMNMAYYNMLFDRAADEFYGEIGIGANYAAERGFTTYLAEIHIRYLRELHLGNKVTVKSWILDHDAKRYHGWQEVWHEDGWCAASAEVLSLHIDMSGPKVAPMPDDIAARMADFARRHGRSDLPEGAGGRIGLRRG
ncbi:MAG: thioesterase family protein [Maritimibacter sp.]